MWQNAAMNKILKILFSLINMAAMANPLATKVRVRFGLMVWLKGGKGSL